MVRVWGEEPEAAYSPWDGAIALLTLLKEITEWEGLWGDIYFNPQILQIRKINLREEEV